MLFPDMKKGFDKLDRIFHPSRIAIVGVSAEGFGFGRGILRSLIAIGFSGKMYPVSSSGGSTEGLTIYPSVEEIPEKIDFAVIAVPARHVPAVLDACRKKGAVGAQILSSGFRESGTPEGIELEEELKVIAAKGIRVIGPNCFGIYCPKSGLTMVPGFDFSREPGGVALLSQSGGLSVDFAWLGKWRGIRFSKFLSFGNGCDLRETEMLHYFRHDADTKVICMYVEGVPDGRAFLSAVKETAAAKPVIVIKGGLSESGSRATASHTASLGGQRVIWEAALRQCRAIRVENLQELSDAALAFSLLPQNEYRGCTIVGGGGALGIAAADAAESFGINVPHLRKDIQEGILELLPKPGSSAANPIDIANPFMKPKQLKEVLLRASEDKSVDFHVVISLIFHFHSLKHNTGYTGKLRDLIPCKELAQACNEAAKVGKKPVMVVLPNLKQDENNIEIETIIREARRLYTEAGLPVYDDVKNALRAASLVSNYCRQRKKDSDEDRREEQS